MFFTWTCAGTARNGELARPVSEYRANSAGPVCTAESGGGPTEGAATETATGFKNEIRLAGPIHHRARLGPAVDCVPPRRLGLKQRLILDRGNPTG